MGDADLTPTGRELRDPAANLVECVDSKGLKHTVVAFDEGYRGHTALTTGVELILSFMEYPMVTGLVECIDADMAQARFAYPTGTIWTLKEVMRGFDQVGQAVGARAALEICYLGGMILHEAGETGPLQGCFSHGNLTPWRIGLKGDGQLQIFGYGLAQVEMYEFIKGGAEHIDNDSIRYAPPERLEGQPEGPSADTYSLTVIAYELITGRPLFDQKDGKAMWESVKMAEGVQRVLDTKSLPKKVRDVLANALIYDPDARLSGEAFVETIGGLLDDASIEGRTLSDVMMRMGQTARKSSRKLVNVKATATAAFTPADLKAMAEAESDDDDDLDEAEAETEAEGSGSGQQRWGAVTRERTTGRGRRKPGEKAPQRERRSRREEPEADEADLAVPRRRRRRGTEAALESEAPRRRRRAEDLEARDREGADDLDETDDAEDEDEDEEATQGPARSRGGARDDATNPVVPRSSDGEDDEGSDGEFVPRRRRRRNADPDADLEPVPDDPDQPPADEELPRRRRRRTEDSQAVPAGPRDSASSSAPPEKAPSLPDLKTTAPGKAEPNPVPVEKPAEKAVETPPAQTSGAKAAPPEVKPPEDPKSAAVADARVDAPAGAGATAEALEDGDSPRRRRRRSIDDATADVPSIDANATSVGPASAGVIPDDPGNDDGEISPRRRRRRMGADVEAPVEGADPIDTKTLADGLNDDPPDGDPAPRRRRRRES